ncbi:MAG: putative antigen [Mycobacterium sp.]|jgi:hemophore-related protein|nr:putative antigen [Mycobacterium sp.]
MVKLSSSKLVVALGGLALSLTTGVGVASAQPDLGPVVNTTCSYDQVMLALDAQPGNLGNQFRAQPMAQSMLGRFLASPVDQRWQIAQQVQASPLGQQYIGAILKVANTCNNY